MTQAEILLGILHRTRKSTVAMIEKELAGVTMEPQVAAVYEQEKAAAAALEAKLCALRQPFNVGAKEL